jgi:hypothetical protein
MPPYFRVSVLDLNTEGADLNFNVIKWRGLACPYPRHVSDSAEIPSRLMYVLRLRVVPGRLLEIFALIMVTLGTLSLTVRRFLDFRK